MLIPDMLMRPDWPKLKKSMSQTVVDRRGSGSPLETNNTQVCLAFKSRLAVNFVEYVKRDGIVMFYAKADGAKVLVGILDDGKVTIIDKNGSITMDVKEFLRTHPYHKNVRNPIRRAANLIRDSKCATVLAILQKEENPTIFVPNGDGVTTMSVSRSEVKYLKKIGRIANRRSFKTVTPSDEVAFAISDMAPTKRRTTISRRPLPSIIPTETIREEKEEVMLCNIACAGILKGSDSPLGQMISRIMAEERAEAVQEDEKRIADEEEKIEEMMNAVDSGLDRVPKEFKVSEIATEARKYRNAPRGNYSGSARTESLAQSRTFDPVGILASATRSCLSTLRNLQPRTNAPVGVIESERASPRDKVMEEISKIDTSGWCECSNGGKCPDVPYDDVDLPNAGQIIEICSGLETEQLAGIYAMIRHAKDGDSRLVVEIIRGHMHPRF